MNLASRDQARTLKKNHPMVPPFANFTTFKRHFGLKNFPFSKLQFSKWGDCQHFKVIGPEEIPILDLGAAQAPYFQNP